MRPLSFIRGVLAVLLVAGSAAAQARDEAKPRDLARLQEDLANLDEDLASLRDDGKASALQRRAEEIREEVVYVKVKMRRHQQAGIEGTGVGYDEVAELRRSIGELRADIDRAGSRDTREARLPQGTEILVRLDEHVSSKTARREDRVDASVFRPVRADGAVAISAGSRVRGIVRYSEPAERPSRPGRLELDFDALYLDTLRLDLRTRVVSFHEEDEKAEKAGIGAVLGGVLGGIVGGRKGAVAGVILGGTGAVVASRGDDVELPAGTVVRLRLERPLLIPRR